MGNEYSNFCYGFMVEMENLNPKDRDLLMNGIDEFELRPAKGYNGINGSGYFGYWCNREKDSNGSIAIDPLDFISIQTDVELNRKMINYARDLCKVPNDIIPIWRIIK